MHRLLPLLCLLLTPAAFAGPVMLDRVEASVNAKTVLKTDISRFRETWKLRQQIDPLFSLTPLAQKQSSASDSEIVQFLIEEALISQTFPASDSDVDQAISQILSANKSTPDGLRGALKEQGFTMEDYRSLMRAGKSKRDLIDREIRIKIAISDDEVRMFFNNKYAKKKGANLAHRIQVIFVSMKTYKTPDAAKNAAQGALDAIKGGEAFSEVAKRVSDDDSRASGGDLGSLTEDQMNPLVRDTVVKLAEGQVSQVVGGPKAGGYYLLRVVSRSADDSEQFARVKEEIRNQLAASEYQHQVQLWLERQKQKAFIRKAGEPTLLGTQSPS